MVYLIFFLQDILDANSVDPDQTPRSLIWVYIISKSLFKGMSGINGLENT